MNSELISKDLSNQLELIKNFCIQNGETIATAESVTSGAIQFMLSTAKEAQQIYQGGITAYNAAQKAIHLNADPIYAEKMKGVSSELSTQLARSACILFRSQIGIGITGFATPVPEEGINEVLAYVSITRHGELLVNEKLVPQSTGPAAQWEFAETAIQRLATILSNTKH
ncbi:CinA family protein [Niabella sp. 22666]|uniref:CinA family protein n=1 Tax=Niabella sp. 22666 TaxID=3453954 RepID=UPI003F874ECD